MQLINKRQFQRVHLNASIDIIASNGILHGHSYDFSESGVYIKLSKSQRNSLPIGSIISLQFQNLNYQAPIIKAEVVRQDTQGCAFILLNTQKDGNAEPLNLH